MKKMRVELKSGNKFYCDVCGEEIEYSADFEIKFDYGCEDPNWGSLDGEYELQKELADKDDYDLQERFYDYLSQETLNQCEECRDYGENNYISDFEKAFRKARVKIVRKLALEKKLPEFFEDEEEKKELVAQFDTRKKNLLSEIEKIDEERELLTKKSENE